MAPRVKAKAPAVLTAETPLPVVTELTRVPEVGRVTLVEPVVARVIAFEADSVSTSPPPKVMALVARVVESDEVKVLPSAMVRVDEVAGAVMATLLRLVAVAAPRVGVTRMGEVENTRLVLVVPVVPPAEAK
jgi:hypothetical protein